MDASKMPLDIAGLSVRSQNALLRAGYRTVGDLMDCSEEQLGSIRNLGKNRLTKFSIWFIFIKTVQKNM